jgi:membrane-associated phospholipid phosphatase
VTTVAGAALLNVLARAIVDPRRPPGELGLRHPFASSFPSGHAAEATATYVALGLIVMVLTASRATRVLVWVGVGALIVAVGVLGYSLYQAKKEPEGVQINVGPGGLKIQSK